MGCAGTGGNPSLGEQAAEESASTIGTAVGNADMVQPLTDPTDHPYESNAPYIYLCVSAWPHCLQAALRLAGAAYGERHESFKQREVIFWKAEIASAIQIGRDG